MSRTEDAELVRILGRFRRVRLLVVGDLMLDRFVWGRVERISPEAPVPVVAVTHENDHLGGAANVAANVRALGGHATVVGVVGRDEAGRKVVGELRRIGVGTSGVVATSRAPTTRKTRIVAHQQQVVRLDREHRLADPALDARIRERVRRLLARVDGVVVSDYAKGVVSAGLLTDLADREGRPPLFVDPKQGNFANYRNATIVKPNLEAAKAASGIDVSDDASLREAGRTLLAAWTSDAILLSRGEQGMTLFRRGRRGMDHFPTEAREVFDVTGAGDTVLATAALAVAAGATFEQAARLANRAAGIVVGKRGTATVEAGELARELERDAGR